MCELISNRKNDMALALLCENFPSIGVIEFLLDVKAEEKVVIDGGPFKGLVFLIIKQTGKKYVILKKKNILYTYFET